MDNTVKTLHNDKAIFETYEQGGDSFLRLTTCAETQDGTFYDVIISGLDLNHLEITSDIISNFGIHESSLTLKFHTNYDVVVCQQCDASPIDNIDGLEEMI